MIFEVVWKKTRKGDAKVFIEASNAAKAVQILHQKLEGELDEVQGLSQVIFKDGVAKVEEEILCY